MLAATRLPVAELLSLPPFMLPLVELLFWLPCRLVELSFLLSARLVLVDRLELSVLVVLPPFMLPLVELLLRLPFVDLLLATSVTATSPTAVPPPLADDLPAPPDVLVCD